MLSDCTDSHSCLPMGLLALVLQLKIYVVASRTRATGTTSCHKVLTCTPRECNTSGGKRKTKKQHTHGQKVHVLLNKTTASCTSSLTADGRSTARRHTVALPPRRATSCTRARKQHSQRLLLCPAHPPCGAHPEGSSPFPIPVIGSIARGTQRLNCSMHGPWSRALNNSAVECRVLWNQLPEFVKDYF